jgi:hypothetical protein
MARNTTDAYMPAKELLEVLAPSYAPCRCFEQECGGTMRWDPQRGHIPRGYLGAFNSIEQVKLVLISAEPGNPYGDEDYGAVSNDSIACMSTVTSKVFRYFESGKDQFHRNTRYILDGCFPGMSLKDQLAHVWMTESVLCSAPRESGPVPMKVANACGMLYLSRQLSLFSPDVIVATLGSKACDRMPKELKRRVDIEATAVAPPGCNFKGAKESWERIIKLVRARFQE